MAYEDAAPEPVSDRSQVVLDAEPDPVEDHAEYADNDQGDTETERLTALVRLGYTVVSSTFSDYRKTAANSRVW